MQPHRLHMYSNWYAQQKQELQGACATRSADKSALPMQYLEGRAGTKKEAHSWPGRRSQRTIIVRASRRWLTMTKLWISAAVLYYLLAVLW